MTYNKERITDFEGKTVQYEWDSLNRRTATVYPDESKVGYKWDNTGRLASVVSGTGVTNYAYDAMGRISGRVLPDGTATKYELNPLGRLTSLTHSKDGGVLDQFKYSYDPAGNITQIDKHRAGIETDSGLFEYAYDPVGRLVSAMHDGNTKEYRYDSLGNRISSLQNGVETKHSYNARNQLIRSTEPEIEREYAYDKRGNLTSITKNGTLESRYDFDATNMMVAAFTEGKGKAEYSYNGFLKRVKRLETLQDTGMPDPTKELRYILDMMLPYDNLLMTQGSQNQSFVWGNELLMAEGEKPFGYLQDHLGSPVRLVGADVDEALAFDEFGVPLVGAGEKMHQPFGFTGYQTDSISGLYFAQARYFDPATSRFSAEDTHWHPGNMIFGDKPYNIPSNFVIRQSANLYSYCINNPIIFIDLTGEIVTILHHDIKGKPYNHVDISINDRVYSFGPYDQDSTKWKGMYSKGVIMDADKEGYIENEKKKGTITTEYQLNLTQEQEDALLAAIKGYLDGEQLNIDSDFAKYFYGKKEDGLNHYLALGDLRSLAALVNSNTKGIASFLANLLASAGLDMNCVAFVTKIFKDANVPFPNLPIDMPWAVLLALLINPEGCPQ